MEFRSDLLLRSINNEFYIVDPGDEVADLSNVYTLTETAVFLWKEFKGRKFTKELLIAEVVREYEIDLFTASSDIHKLLCCFKKHGFLID